MKEAKKKLDTSVGVSNDLSISALGAFFVYLITGLFLAVGFWVARNKFSVDLVSDPSLTLFLLWSIEFPVVVIIYSFLRKAPEKWAFLNALGAISLGAPIGMQYLPRTVHWSFLMSVFTVSCLSAAAAAAAFPMTLKEAMMLILRIFFGASWTDWHRLFASMKPSGNVEYMIFIPAYGTIIGGWFGAWPMPLDWERPWQEWPICVCYGAIGGYIVGQIVSLCAMFFFRKDKHLKIEK
ncbi:hypothetical protein Bca101_095101 [Brassica carinata]